ncbi:MAG: DDE-type integrase/transposase/recombinase [Myxococcota bacterium]|nr:DDE-type integrase/transposase/recombinase [Myxococcota bacterium]
MSDPDDRESWERWARLRFAIVGRLLAQPPARGELREQLEHLSRSLWPDPVSGRPRAFAFSTIERWYYLCRNEVRDPVGVLRRRVRKDAGQQPSLSRPLRDTIRALHKEHPSWTYRLHVDNLGVLVEEVPELGPMPSYSSVLRYMKSHGLLRRRRRKRADTEGGQRALERLETREVRSFEAAYVSGLWHADFHHGSRRVITREARWVTPILLGVLDDRSRLACHVQWYFDETAETYLHGLSQAFQKRGLPRELMHDNGKAMLAAETQGGLFRLGVKSSPTLPYSPYQNAKIEFLWSQIEGRLLPMLESVKELTLDLLNEATSAWVEREYNRAHHTEIGTSPIRRFIDDRDVGRECPGSDALRRAFKRSASRTQRRSDGTISVKGSRFEVPSRYRNLQRLRVRYAEWDLRSVELVDPRSGTLLCDVYPVDKSANAEGIRRTFEPEALLDESPSANATGGGIAPLLRKLMAEYAATGLPPAYIPKHDRPSEADETEDLS